MPPVALLASSLLLHVQMSGSFVTGADLLNECTSAVPVRMSDCLGYVTGIADAIGAAEPVLRERFGIPAVICLPAGTRRGEIKDAVVARLRAAPAQNSQGAGFLVTQALMKTWPCSGMEGAQ